MEVSINGYMGAKQMVTERSWKPLGFESDMRVNTHFESLSVLHIGLSTLPW
jgi:hypothetical protein